MIYNEEEDSDEIASKEIKINKVERKSRVIAKVEEKPQVNETVQRQEET